MKLRPYQENYVSEIREAFKKGNRRVIMCAPTGSGKTATFSHMVTEHLKRGGNVLIFTHRSELLKQSGNALENPEFITAKSQPKLSASLHIAMVETFYSRLDEYISLLESKSLIIIDEAHLQSFTKLLPFIPENTYVIGATATPFRKPKDVQLSDFYQSLIHEIDTPELIENGFLCPAKTYGIPIDLTGLKKSGDDYNTKDFYSKNQTYKGVVENWKKYAWFTKTILFASNIESSKEVCAEFVLNGFKARHVDGKMNETKRTEIFEWFNSTPDAILCNCGIATAGFDQPDLLTVILYRATTSLPLFLQMCGRGSRLSPNKTHFNILDFGNNIQRFGFWEESREWKLEYSKTTTKEKASPVKDCPECGAMNYASARICQICAYEFPLSKEEEIERVQLQELHRVLNMDKTLNDLGLNEIATLQRMGKLSAPMAWRIVRTMDKSLIGHYADLMGYSYGWVYRQQNEPIGFKNKHLSEL